MSNNYKCKICKDTGIKFKYDGIYKLHSNDTIPKHHETECDCVEITDLTTEEDLNNNAMRIEVKINI
jgi:hypothetical protein